MPTDREKFSEIYETGAWSEDYTVPLSGPGSSIRNSLPAINLITRLHSERAIRSILDIGCGDLSWLSSIETIRNGELEYFGIDIVSSVIESNHREYPWFRGSCEDALERRRLDADLVIAKDLVFHMTNAQISTLLNILRNSTWRFCLFSNYECNSNEARILDERYHFAEVNLALPPFSISRWSEMFARPAGGVFLLIEPHHLA